LIASSTAKPSTPRASRTSAAPGPRTTSSSEPPEVRTGRATASAPVTASGDRSLRANSGGETCGGRSREGASAVERAGVTTSADDVLERISERTGLIGVQLDNEAATTLEGNAHHDAASFLGDLQRTV